MGTESDGNNEHRETNKTDWIRTGVGVKGSVDSWRMMGYRLIRSGRLLSTEFWAYCLFFWFYINIGLDIFVYRDILLFLAYISRRYQSTEEGWKSTREYASFSKVLKKSREGVHMRCADVDQKSAI